MVSKKSFLDFFLQKLLTITASLPRPFKSLVLSLLDFSLLLISLLLSFAVRFDPITLLTSISHFFIGAGLWVVLNLGCIGLIGWYRPILRFAGLELIGLASRGVFIGTLGFVTLEWLTKEVLLPRSIVVMAAIFGLLSLISMRLIFRWIIRVHLLGSTNQIRSAVAIFGAGVAGMELYESLLHQQTYLVRVFVA